MLTYDGQQTQTHSFMIIPCVNCKRINNLKVLKARENWCKYILTHMCVTEVGAEGTKSTEILKSIFTGISLTKNNQVFFKKVTFNNKIIDNLFKEIS